MGREKSSEQTLRFDPGLFAPLHSARLPTLWLVIHLRDVRRYVCFLFRCISLIANTLAPQFSSALALFLFSENFKSVKCSSRNISRTWAWKKKEEEEKECQDGVLKFLSGGKYYLSLFLLGIVKSCSYSQTDAATNKINTSERKVPLFFLSQ